MRMSLVRASSWWVVAACSPLLVAACVSPDNVARETDAGDVGTGGQSGPGSGGSTGAGQGGSGGSGQGGRGMGGSGTTGVGGRLGGAGSGVGGTMVVGPGANLTDDFETGDVTRRWLAPQSSDSTPCGVWAVVAEGTNHVYQQTSTACTSSNPSWAAGGSTSWVDLRLQVKVRFDTAGSTITIAVRYNNPKDLYWIEFTNDGRIKIRTRTLTTSSVDVTSTPSNQRVPVPAGQWTTVGLGISGSTITAYLGDNRAAPPALTGTASGQTMGGIAIGVAGGTASFDDVLVTPP
jgi:hypothetical protein